MFTRLLQIRAVGGTVERHLALFAAALGADTPVDGWTEALFLPDVADGTAHWSIISCPFTQEKPSSTAETQRPQRTFFVGSYVFLGVSAVKSENGSAAQCTIPGAIVSARINPCNRGHKPFLFVPLRPTR
ncbi:MAG TPA: hypothetical protein VF953_12855 [Terriglobales bacterium]